VNDEEGGDKNMKKSLFSRVFGGCIPWLATHDADGEKEIRIKIKKNINIDPPSGERYYCKKLI
jgi:hypothetical protein